MDDCKLIKLYLWTKKPIKDKTIGKELIRLFLSRDDELKPIYWFGSDHTNDKNIKINADTPKIFMDALLDFSENHGFLRNPHYAFSNIGKNKNKFIFRIAFGTISNMFDDLSIEISHEYFTSQERIDKFLAISWEIILLLNPFYGKIHDISDGLKGVSNNQTVNVLKKIPRIFWGNYFGDMYIEQIGEEKLLSCKAYKTEKIGNGIYIQLTKSPLDFDTDECKQARKRIENHIGKKYFGYEEHKTINELFKR